GNTAFFASLFIVSVLYMFIGKQVPGGFKLLVLSMFLIDIFVVSSWFGLEKVRDRLEATSLATESRDEVVFDTVDIIKEFPVTGTGAGSYETVFASFQSNNVNANYDHAHNDYLEFSLEYGLPVTLLLGLLLCFICAISIKTLSKAKDRRLAGTAAAALMAVVGMLMHMSVDFPLVAPANSSFFILLLALACIAYNLLNNELNPTVNHTEPV
ncbi:O-antigen ligase family protein, partial [Alteromonas sp. AMM-1]|uniref:O-antigen ligase family protein n=1 Tax=Alteromonas sp. AMM-1 TaxID=3394233 RepID=UPI0039A6986E